MKTAYARRYAQVAFEIAREKGELDRWQSDLSKIATLTADASVVAFLENPKLRFADKAKLLSERLGGMSPLVLNLVYLLVAKGRVGAMGEITKEYRRLLNSHRGIAEAEVITAVLLDEADRQRLAERLGTIVGQKVVIKSSVNPAIVGGIVARIGDKLIDASTRSRLEALKKRLSGVTE